MSRTAPQQHCRLDRSRILGHERGVSGRKLDTPEGSLRVAALETFCFSRSWVTSRVAVREQRLWRAADGIRQRDGQVLELILHSNPYLATSKAVDELIAQQLGALGWKVVIRAYDVAEASAVQPFAYVQLPIISMLGLLIFDESLRPSVVLGSAIVVAAGVFTLWRQRQLEKGTARR